MLQTAEEEEEEEEERVNDCDSHNAEKLAKIRMRNGRTDGQTDRVTAGGRGRGEGGEANPIR